MSGKLKILGHKSWNVWNKDNIKRVERDEREAKEAAERVEGVVASSTATIPSTRSNGREQDKRREKGKKSAPKRGRDGTALGLGANELRGDQPFYLQPTPASMTMSAASSASNAIVIRGRVVHGTEAIQARARDTRRKLSDDPASSFLSRSEQEQRTCTPEFERGDARAGTMAVTSAKAEEATPVLVDMRTLRAERLAREVKERRRAARLFTV
jgi:hypothetical protein